jgi:hypothetical protein
MYPMDSPERNGIVAAYIDVMRILLIGASRAPLPGSWTFTWDRLTLVDVPECYYSGLVLGIPGPHRSTDASRLP